MSVSLLKFTPATFATPIPDAADTAGVSFETARKIYERMVEHYKNTGWDITAHRVAFVQQGMNRDEWNNDRPVLCHDFDDNPAWAIVWEGDYEWIYDDFMDTLGNDLGVFIEPVNSWSVRMYPR